MEPQTQPKKSFSIPPMLYWVVIGVLLVVCIILAVFYNNAVAKKNQQINEMQNQVVSQQQDINKLKAGQKEGQVQIPELKLQFPLNDTTSKVVYIVDTRDVDHPNMSLTTKPLMLSQFVASQLVPGPQKNACGAAEGASGTLNRYRLGETYKSQPIEGVQNKDIRKIGEFYWVYTPPPTTCSVNQAVQEEQKKATDQSRVFFNSLEQL